MAPSSLATVASLPFRAGSALRGRRVFHPDGLLCTGRWTIDRTDPLAPSATPLHEGAAFDCLVRASRGAGFPEGLPDFPGFAVRLLDAHGPGRHQDVLANASADLPVVHHLFLPATSWGSQSYSTALPYDAGAGPIVIGLVPLERPGPALTLGALRAALDGGGLAYAVAVAAPLGRWRRIGRLDLGPTTETPEDPRFDPWHCGGGLRPVGALQRWRRAAYEQSRKGRGAA